MKKVDPEDAARMIRNVEVMCDALNRCEIESAFEQLLVLHVVQDAVLKGIDEGLDGSENETEASVETTEVADDHQRQQEEAGRI